jgi:iron complex outermembrane receptor protein
MRKLNTFVLVALTTAALVGLPTKAAAQTSPPADLSLEDLLKADVVTAARKSQAQQDVAAAVFVVTREDIERSGATSLPEALRLVPGVQVARLASGRWAVSVRGFNSRFANKLLVLMDGRSVYSPLFSGVVWEMEGTLLEDIDRIEVIRGPGAALWGANAVNGVINILTRKARATQGGLLAISTGSVERGAVAARFGGSLPEGHYRVWAKRESHRAFENGVGSKGLDAWQTTRFGFRADTALGSSDSLTVSGNLIRTSAGDRWIEASLFSPTGFQIADRTQRADVGHLLARYSRLGDDGSETIVQTYLAHNRLEVIDRVDERRTTADLDVQHRPRSAGMHDLVWGFNYRVSRDEISGQGIIAVAPARRNITLGSAFVNDEITLVPEQLRATLGLRLERNSFTGTEPQGHVRLAWTPSRTRTLWAAYSRAVRTPSRAESDLQFDLAVMPARPPVPAVLTRSPAPKGSLSAEVVKAFELGYRQQFGIDLALDVAVFRNRYEQLLTGGLGGQTFAMQPMPHVVQLIDRSKSQTAVTRGLELALDWRAQRHWRLQAIYSHFDVATTVGTGDPVADGAALARTANSPRHQWALRSSLAMGKAGEFEARLRRVTEVQASIPAYTELDLRYALRPMPGLTLSISGENLLHARHAEFKPDLLPSEPLQVPRSVHVKAQWMF